MGGGTLERTGTSRRTLGVVEDGSVDHLWGPGWVEGTSRRSGTGLGTHEKFRDGSGDPRGSLGPVGGT